MKYKGLSYWLLKTVTEAFFTNPIKGQRLTQYAQPVKCLLKGSSKTIVIDVVKNWIGQGLVMELVFDVPHLTNHYILPQV